MDIVSFKEIVKQYKVVFFDSYGVIKSSKGLIEGASETIDYIQDLGITYFILTNDASRSPSQMAQQFRDLGLKTLSKFQIVTSGMMAKAYFQYKVKSGKVAYVGTPNAAYYIQSLGLEAVHMHDLEYHLPQTINGFVFLDDEGFQWDSSINAAINFLRKHNVPTIVANTDYVYPIGNSKVSLAVGGIASLIETVVQKEFIKFGKPDPQMFMYAYEQLFKTYETIEKSDILMVGDTLHIDILGGNKFGVDTALVLSGNTLEDRVASMIENSGIIPTYICSSIAS